MKAIVTGGTSGIGRNLVDILVEKGWTVYVLYRPTSNIKDLPEGVHLKCIDYRPFRMPVDRADAVFHCAGNTSHWRGDKDEQWCDNVLFTQNVVEAARYSGVEKFIHLSTAATHPLRGWDAANVIQKYHSNNYIKTKRLSELEIPRFGPNHNIVSPTVCLGKYDRSYTKLVDYIRGGGNMVLPGRMGFVSSREVAGAMLEAVTYGIRGQNYILTAPQVEWLSFFRLVAMELGTKVPEKATPLWALKQIATAQEAWAEWKQSTPSITHDFLYLLRDYEFNVDEMRKSKYYLHFEPTPLGQLVKETVHAAK